MEIQNAVAEKYMTAQKELTELKRQLKQAELKMKNIYEENLS